MTLFVIYLRRIAFWEYNNNGDYVIRVDYLLNELIKKINYCMLLEASRTIDENGQN